MKSSQDVETQIRRCGQSDIDLLILERSHRQLDGSESRDLVGADGVARSARVKITSHPAGSDAAEGTHHTIGIQWGTRRILQCRDPATHIFGLGIDAQFCEPLTSTIGEHPAKVIDATAGIDPESYE